MHTSGNALGASLFAAGNIIEQVKGYRDVTFVEDYFIAVGTGGRIDRINKTGEIYPLNNDLKEDLNSVTTNGQVIIAAGVNGTIVVSTDKLTFRKIEIGTDMEIFSITSFNGVIIAAAEDGTVLTTSDTERWCSTKLPVKGEIVSLSAGASVCAGITTKGEIVSTSDAVNWGVFDYNQKYAGYGKPCIFTDVIVTSDRIAVAGYHEDRSPAVLISSMGTVWMERLLNYTDDSGMMEYFSGILNSIGYDRTEDQFFVVSGDGDLLSLPSCTRCNGRLKVSEKNLTSVICSDNTLMLAGDDFCVHTIPLR